MTGQTMLRTAALAALERALNAALDLDPASRQRLNNLAGKVFHIECLSPQLDLFVSPQPHWLALAASYEGVTDARLVGAADDFIALANSADPASELINGPITLHGDSHALQELQQILKSLDIDWEAPLARIFGDVAGHQLGRALRGASQRARYIGDRLLRQGNHWLNQESGWLPASDEVTAFCAEVDELSARTDRLEARLRQLRQRLSRGMRP